MPSIYSQHKPSGSDNMYLKLKDGDKVKLRIVSPPAVSSYDGEKLRYNWIVWNHNIKQPQVYSAGVSVYNQIADLVEEWGEPDLYDITIKRTGSTMQDTEYNVTPVKDSVDMSKTEAALYDKIDLLAACKGKWLEDYLKDDIMPDAIKPKAKEDVVIEDIGDQPINLDDIPFG